MLFALTVRNSSFEESSVLASARDRVMVYESEYIFTGEAHKYFRQK